MKTRQSPKTVPFGLRNGRAYLLFRSTSRGKKRLFFHFPLVIGKPYYINQDKEKLLTEEYDALAEELMQKIKELRPLGRIRGNGEASAQ